MEKLLHSSYPTQFRIRPMSSPFLPQLGRVNSPKLNFNPEFRRINSISFKLENPSPISPCSSRFRVDSAKGSVPESQSVASDDGGGDLGKKKVTFMLLSALAMLAILPALAPPAFATGTAVIGKSPMRGELLSSAWTGFFAGCLHTLSGPDHLAALSPLSIGRTRTESAAVGALWGCGHDAGQVLFGIIFLLLKNRLQIEIIQTWSTVIVGLTLIVIGAMGIREASEVHAPRVALENMECDVSGYANATVAAVAGGKGIREASEVHAPRVGVENGECDVSGYGNATVAAAAAGGRKKVGFATFATGMVHGLQPDAMMMVVPALALPSRVAGAAYLGMFLVGTVVAMGSYTAFIGSCSEALKDKVPRITEKLTWVSSIVAIGLGLVIVFSQYFGYSLY